MATSSYFNHTPNRITQEQTLIEDLIVEQIKLWGTDVYYLPRKSLDKFDPIYGEDPISLFTKAYSMEMYINQPTGSDESVDFFSKFGLEIRHTQKFILARRTFLKYAKNEVQRPKEGDLIFVPTFNNMYEIKKVNEDKSYYILGRKAPYFMYYELDIEMHKFSHDRFLTGIKDIDDVGRQYGYSIAMAMTPPGNGIKYRVGEQVYQGPNVAFAAASAVVAGFITANTTLDITNVIGVFANGVTVIGNTSNAQYTVSSYNRQLGTQFEDINNNVDIENESNPLIHFDTNDPFGTP